MYYLCLLSAHYLDEYSELELESFYQQKQALNQDKKVPKNSLNDIMKEIQFIITGSLKIQVFNFWKNYSLKKDSNISAILMNMITNDIFCQHIVSSLKKYNIIFKFYRIKKIFLIFSQVEHEIFNNNDKYWNYICKYIHWFDQKSIDRLKFLLYFTFQNHFKFKIDMKNIKFNDINDEKSIVNNLSTKIQINGQSTYEVSKIVKQSQEEYVKIFEKGFQNLIKKKVIINNCLKNETKDLMNKLKNANLTFQWIYNAYQGDLFNKVMYIDDFRHNITDAIIYFIQKQIPFKLLFKDDKNVLSTYIKSPNIYIIGTQNTLFELKYPQIYNFNWLKWCKLQNKIVSSKNMNIKQQQKYIIKKSFNKTNIINKIVMQHDTNIITATNNFDMSIFSGIKRPRDYVPPESINKKQKI